MCKAERDSAFYIACTADENVFLKPISVLDVFQTLQVDSIFTQYYKEIFSTNVLQLLLVRFKKIWFRATQFMLLTWKGYHKNYIIQISNIQRIPINTRITNKGVFSKYLCTVHLNKIIFLMIVFLFNYFITLLGNQCTHIPLAKY